MTCTCKHDCDSRIVISTDYITIVEGLKDWPLPHPFVYDRNRYN